MVSFRSSSSAVMSNEPTVQGLQHPGERGDVAADPGGHRGGLLHQVDGQVSGGQVAK